MSYSELKATVTPAKKLVVMLHGVGSYGDDLIALAPIMSHKLPECHFFSPNGIEAYDMAAFGYQWFSLRDRSWPVLMPQIAKNTILLQNIIKQKQQELDLTNAQTILLGFSQGTMMASYLTLAESASYYAMIGFSGRLAHPEIIKNTNTPICLIHGKEDQVVPYQESEKFQQYATLHNINCQLKIVSNLAHSIDMSGIEFAINFLKKLEERNE
jgi:phospholipase/carboxylesterase